MGSPHGLDGSFYVTHPEPSLLDLGTPVRVGDRDTRIERRAGTDARPLVRLEGVPTRDAAAALRDQPLWVARADAPALGDDEYWADDLCACEVTDGKRRVGTVARVIALPSNEVLEVVRGQGEAPLLVPLVRDAVRAVDLRARRIDVDLEFLGEA